MLFAVRRRATTRTIRRRVIVGAISREQLMIWETPVAIDFRFGMEITMYVSNR